MDFKRLSHRVWLCLFLAIILSGFWEISKTKNLDTGERVAIVFVAWIFYFFITIAISKDQYKALDMAFFYIPSLLKKFNKAIDKLEK